MGQEKEKSFLEKLKAFRDHKYFEYFIIGVILLAGIVVGLQSFESLKHNQFLIILDEIILLIFILEIVIKLVAEDDWKKYFYNGGIDYWHAFDVIIVSVCVLPYFISGAHTEFFAVLRMARIMRVVKIFEQVKKLKSLVDSLMNSLPSMTYVMIMLLMLFYIYGVIGTDLFGKFMPSEYGDLFLSMRSLFFVATEGWSGTLENPEIQKAITENIIGSNVITIYFTSFFVLGAMIFLNLLIGVITSEISDTKESEKMGKSKINVKNHTIILGWNQQIYKIIEELVEHNRDFNTSQHIVILSELEKLEMESDIMNKIDNLDSHKIDPTKIHYRTGSAIDMDDLENLNIEQSKSIIILSDELDIEVDYNTTKIIMALYHIMYSNDDKERTKYPHIVAQLHDFDKFKKIIEEVGNLKYSNNKNVKEINHQTPVLIPINDWISRLIVQTSLQPGLASVYDKILGYSGSEFYVKDIDSEIIGSTLIKSIGEYKNSLLLGRIKLDKKGEPIVNLAFKQKNEDKKYEVYTFNKNDKLIFLSENSDGISRHKWKKGINNPAKNSKSNDPIIQNDNQIILIIGWNSKGKKIIEEIGKYLQEKTKVYIYDNFIESLKGAPHSKKMQEDHKKEIDVIDKEFGERVSILTNKSNEDLETFLMKEIVEKNINKIILLSYYEYLKDSQKADSKTLVNLINIRSVINTINEENKKSKKQENKISIVSEMHDVNNKMIAQIDDLTDFVISADLLSGITAQLSQNKEFYEVYNYIFSEHGEEIYLIDMSNFFEKKELEKNITFKEIIERVYCKEDRIGMPIGYILSEDKGDKVKINPDKEEEIELSENDKLIVFLEDLFKRKQAK